jgi:spore germination protein GerM
MSKQSLLIGLIITLVLAGVIGYFIIGQEKTITVKIFFGNIKEDPEVLDCEKVYSVERLVFKNKAMIQALEELLKGPTLEEQEKGYLTNINSGVIINSLVVENSIAKVDFDEQLGYQVGGSCRVMAIRSQITETLKQFSEVKDVIISINGRIEDILQP